MWDTFFGVWLASGSQPEESYLWQGHEAEALMGKANQASGFPPIISWACTPQNQKYASLCTLLFHSSDTLWKKLIQGFSLLQKNVLT